MKNIRASSPSRNVVLPTVVGGLMIAGLIANATNAIDLTGQDSSFKPTAGTSLSRPLSSNTPKVPHGLAGVVSIIEADVTAARYTFDITTGPRTELSLANLVVHAGSAPPNPILSIFGGPTPDGRYISTAELPVLQPGSRYFLLLGSGDWYYSPIWADLAFRIDNVSGRQIVTGMSGTTVLGFDSTGALYGTTRLIKRENQADPLQPLRIDSNVDVAAADVKTAMDSATFVKAAIDAVAGSGATFGRPSDIAVPTPRPRWDIVPTTSSPSTN